MDAQGHVGTSLGAAPTGGESGSLGEVLLGKRRDIQEAAIQTDLDGLWVVPSDRELNVTESVMSARIGKELLLRQSMKYARTHFDTIVIDCPPNLGSLTVNALVAADKLLIPCDLSLLSLDGVEALLETVETVQETLNPGLEVLGLLRTRVDRRNQKVNATIEDVLRDRFGSILLDSEIGISTAVTQAQLAGKPVYTFDTKGRAATAYRELCAEVSDRLAAS
jgi:chromosome partitioning protein